MNTEQKIRYARQIAISEIGKKGQEKLLNAKILIIGCGALGSMVAMQLAGAGVGCLGLADFDNIDISNLQRQFFFKTSDTGFPKAQKIAIAINELNPEIKVNVFSEMITSKKADILFREYDFIIDATDNPDSKRMTGNISKKVGKSCCIGGVRDFQGQVMTFLPDDPRFEDYFGNVSDNSFLPCSLGGVIGSTAALCASIQASETIKYLTSAGDLLSGKLLLFNLLTNSFRLISL